MALLLKDLAIGALPILGVPLLVLVVAGKARRSRLLSILDKLIPPLLMIYWIIWFVRTVQYFRGGSSSSASQVVLLTIHWLLNHRLLVSIVVGFPFLLILLVLLLITGRTLWNRARRAN